MKNGTAFVPGWYVEFQANALRQLPRPGELDPTTADSWNRNQKELKNVLAGALLPSKEGHIIDCDADPFVPTSRWKVESHQKGGKLIFDPAKIKLYLSPNQQSGKYITGDELRKELENKLVLNANVLDYLMKNPYLIPEDWKKDRKGNVRYIFFWGTIYIDPGSHQFVPRLFWSPVVSKWFCDTHMLSDHWGGYDPATVLVN